MPAKVITEKSYYMVIRYPLHNSTGAFCVWVRVLSNYYRDCAIITWRGGKLEGGIGENDNKREGGLDLKFNTYRGGITFSFLFANWKSSGRVIGVQIIRNTNIGKFINSKVF